MDSLSLSSAIKDLQSLTENSASDVKIECQVASGILRYVDFLMPERSGRLTLNQDGSVDAEVIDNTSLEITFWRHFDNSDILPVQEIIALLLRELGFEKTA